MPTSRRFPTDSGSSDRAGSSRSTPRRAHGKAIEKTRVCVTACYRSTRVLALVRLGPEPCSTVGAAMLLLPPAGARPSMRHRQLC